MNGIRVNHAESNASFSDHNATFKHFYEHLLDPKFCRSLPNAKNEIETSFPIVGAVSQDTVISTNITIVAIGAAAIFAGFTAPAWGPVALIGVSVAVTASYIKNLF